MKILIKNGIFFWSPYSKNVLPKKSSSFKVYLSRLNRKQNTKNLSICNIFLIIVMPQWLDILHSATQIKFCIRPWVAFHMQDYCWLVWSFLLKCCIGRSICVDGRRTVWAVDGMSPIRTWHWPVILIFPLLGLGSFSQYLLLMPETLFSMLVPELISWYLL